MKKVYPVVLTPSDENSYCVYVPDLEINTDGESLAAAIDMARDAISVWILHQEDEKKPVPAPSNIEAVAHDEGELVTLVDVDIDAYRRAVDWRTVRKNVSLPSWLNERGEAAGLNFSQVLQEAIKARLQLD